MASDTSMTENRVLNSCTFYSASENPWKWKLSVLYFASKFLFPKNLWPKTNTILGVFSLMLLSGPQAPRVHSKGEKKWTGQRCVVSTFKRSQNKLVSLCLLMRRLFSLTILPFTQQSSASVQPVFASATYQQPEGPWIVFRDSHDGEACSPVNTINREHAGWIIAPQLGSDWQLTESFNRNQCSLRAI